MMNNAKSIAEKLEFLAKGRGYRTPSGDLVKLVQVMPKGGRVVYCYDDGAIAFHSYQKYSFEEYMENFWFNRPMMDINDDVVIDCVEGSVSDSSDLVTLSDLAYDALRNAYDEFGMGEVC